MTRTGFRSGLIDRAQTSRPASRPNPRQALQYPHRAVSAPSRRMSIGFGGSSCSMTKPTPPWLNGVVAARVSQRLPVVLSVGEVDTVLNRMRGTSALVARLLYGSGLRILECLRLRVKDIDFASHEILVRDGKGAKDRVTMLPGSLVEPLQRHLDRVRELHADDVAAGFGSVYLPHALGRKYPNAGKNWMWQYAFPSARLSNDPRSGVPRRHHADEKPIQRALQSALRAAGIHKPATPHTLRHSFRHAPAPVRLRHQNRAGAARPFGRIHDHDLHARAESRRARRGEPARCLRKPLRRS